MLVKFVQYKNHWDEFLDKSIVAYNTSIQQSTNLTPFELMFGRKATISIDVEMLKQTAEEKIIVFKYNYERRRGNLDVSY